MTAQSQPYLSGLSTAFLGTVNRTLANINAAQVAAAEEKTKKDQEKKTALTARIDKARIGLHRLLEFGSSPGMQQVVEDMGRLPNKEASVTFCEMDWCNIGGQLTSSLVILFEKDWVRIVAVNLAWVRNTKAFYLAYNTGATMCEEWLEGRTPSEKRLLEEDLLLEIATLEVVELSGLDEYIYNNSPSEEEVLFQKLVDWSRPAAFGKTVVQCMRQLERTMQRINCAI